MNDTEARAFRAAHDAAVKRYSRMTRAKLVIEETALMLEKGSERLYQSGPSSHDELVRSVMDLRGYTVAKLNESTHVIAHEVPWPDCEWCQAAKVIGTDGKINPAYVAEQLADVLPTGTGWPVKR